MLGAIAGDIIGSIYENRPIKTKRFPLFSPGCTFTDDTVCTVAIADVLLGDGDFGHALRRYVRKYPGRGYGGLFREWAMADDLPAYGSWGNGSAMRVSAVGFLARDDGEALRLAAASSAVSHSHSDAIAGAQAVALAIHMARRRADRTTIRRVLSERFGYDLSRSLDDLRPGYAFDISAAGTVPAALICALDATDHEDAVRNAISLGGDADTLACIAGGLGEALYGISERMARETFERLDERRYGFPEELDPDAPGFFEGRLLTVVEAFYRRLGALA